MLNEPIVFLCVAHLVSAHLVCIRLFSQPASAAFPYPALWGCVRPTAVPARPVRGLTAWSCYQRTGDAEPGRALFPLVSCAGAETQPPSPCLKLTTMADGSGSRQDMECCCSYFLVASCVGKLIFHSLTPLKLTRSSPREENWSRCQI